MGHRINEQNSGHWTTEGQPKARRAKRILSVADRAFIAAVLDKVLSAVEFDPEVSGEDVTQHDPRSRWTDGGRFIISLSREQVVLLGEIVSGL